MTARGQHPRDFGGDALVAAADAPLADQERDAQRCTATLFAAVLLVAFACREPERARPAEQVIVEATSQPASRPAEVRGATLAVDLTWTASISVERLRAHVTHLASDALEGRGPSTAGIEKAAEYLERELAAIGLKPAFAGGFRQPFEMTVGMRAGEENGIVQQGARPLTLRRDFLPYALSASAVVEAPLVFAGFGITAKEHQYDDYAGIEPEGKVLVIFADEPGDHDPKSPFDGRKPTRHASIRTKVLRARESKARAVLIIVEQMKDPAKSAGAEADSGIVAMQITAAAAKALLGFDPVALKKEIDRAYAPRSKASTRPPVKVTASILREKRTVSNVAGVLVPATATSTIGVVIGAHYDHLGYGGSNSLSDSEKPLIHNGADDNASGTAAVIEAARALVSDPRGLKRRVYFALFAGEESGLLGSAQFVANAGVDPKSFAAMINLDMVGRLREGKLNVMGTHTAHELDSLARRVVGGRGLVGTFGGDGYGPSDHTSFYAAGVPVLFLFTGAHEDYHKPSDDAEKIEYAGLARVTGIATDLVRTLAINEARPTYRAAPPPAPLGGGGGGYGPYFGSIPEFGEQKGGVLLAGVRAGSPAEKAGVQKGDLIVRFNDIEIKSLEDFTVALRDCAPGDVVKVDVMRNGERLTMKATLEKRK